MTGQRARNVSELQIILGKLFTAGGIEKGLAFQPEPSDVIISPFAKSGTTWMQSICGLLIFGEPDADIAYPEISPWVEFSLSSKLIETRLALLKAQTHQRFIKSHSPLDGVPYFKDCTYLVCHRHHKTVI